jgi:transcriptional regulator with XRE-family HTH domain
MWILKNKEVAKRLKQARQEHHLSSRQFALQAGVDQSQYLKIEKAKLPITKRTMAKLVTKYGLVQDYILYGNNPPKDALMKEDQAEYQVPFRDKVNAHDALLSVLVSEIAALRASASGEHPEVIMKKIYKAAEDVEKLGKEE